MPYALPDANSVHPITLPDGQPHLGTVFLRNVVDHPKFKVGDYTYASDFDPPSPDGWASHLAPYLFPMSQETLKIGRYCQIAHGVRFITSSANHAMKGLTCYPFPVFDPEQMIGFQPDTRDTVIGHDVWIGYGAMILPGTHIGNGAIVGAGAVVRGTIPPYAVVTGNPGTVIKYRFDQNKINQLQEQEWWDWPAERVAAAHNALQTGDLKALR
ncbi:CatB-related O-acetyltransferase [Parasedimentitalea maritima]|uniref:CatB-related O-acetyltransferase n=1 Tax=Parasedimentitalea maritima TaxID=2578117 RepID=A0ABY2UR64_9RHOB|nr:CatB-related O-acetyltransferase [Zongyanglinia marina]TLP58346.1 CatB-related O-acetyltransferase [Zongyanglinia marina]